MYSPSPQRVRTFSPFSLAQGVKMTKHNRTDLRNRVESIIGLLVDDAIDVVDYALPDIDLKGLGDEVILDVILDLMSSGDLRCKNITATDSPVTTDSTG